MIGNFGYESALVYYNAYLPDLAPPTHQGRVSAWGFAVGYAGSIAALLTALPFVRSHRYGGAFLCTAGLFAVFAMPAFLFLPAPAPGRLGVWAAARQGAGEVVATARRILALRDLRRFLGAYFLYEDGVNTVVAFSAIFAAQTLGFPMEWLIILYIVVQVSALGGALAWARPSDRLGPKLVVMITLVQWTIVVVTAYFVETAGQFWVLAVVAGTGLGRGAGGQPDVPGTPLPRRHGGGALRLLFAVRQERGRHGAARLRRHLACRGGRSACGHPGHRQLLPHRAGASLPRARGRAGADLGFPRAPSHSS